MITALFEQLSLFRQPATPPVAPPQQRHVLIGAQAVTYTLKQARRRRLTMTIDERGLSVGAPLRISQAEIERFIHSHAGWVLKKLDEYASNNACRHLRIRDGLLLPVLGADATVRIVPGANRIRWQDETLELQARADADCALLARRALQRRALALFTERVAHYADQLGVAVPRLGLSNARTRWGSCNSKTGIRLGWRLIHLPLPLIDYVVAHELAHLIEMNHGARFWAVVESIYPDWRTARRELKLRAAELPIL